MNSWGENYGDDGFMWVKYSDLTKILIKAFVMEIDDYKGWVEGYGCKYGNCFNDYGQNHYKNREGSKTIEEGVFEHVQKLLLQLFYCLRDFYSGFVHNR